jgi:CBS domain-containing protein
VVGIISGSDLLPKVRYAGDDAAGRLFESHSHREAREKAVADLARDLMSAPAVTVTAGTPVVHAVRLMDTAGVKRLPVVDVVGGVVTLTGEVSRRSMVPVAVRLAERVDGVVEVVDQLTYRRDDSVLRSVPETMVRF